MKFLRNLPDFVKSSINHPCRFSGTKYTNSYLQKVLLTMPREPKHISEAQKQRIKIKEKSRNSQYVPGTVNIQVLGSGSCGSPATLYLFTDQWRFEHF